MSSEKKVLHPRLIPDDAKSIAAAGLAPGTFYFTGPDSIRLRQMGVEEEISFFKEAVPYLEQSLPYIEQHLPQMLEEYPPAICLFFLEEIHEKIDWRSASDERRKMGIILKVREKFQDIVLAHKNDALIEALILKSKLISEQSKPQIFADNLRVTLQIHHEKREAVQAQQVIDDLIRNPQNAEFFLGLNSQYRAVLVNKSDLIRQMIQKGKPELHRAIRKYGLIDTVRFPWRRNALYRDLEAAEKTDSTQFIFHRYFDAVNSHNKGFYARRRLAKYKAEADQLSVEFKVNFILEDPERADYFFDDEDFVSDLALRRPDLFLKLMDHDKLFHKIKSQFFDPNNPPTEATIKLAWEGIRYGSLEQVRKIYNLFKNLTWSGYETLKGWAESYLSDLQQKEKQKNLEVNRKDKEEGQAEQKSNIPEIKRKSFAAKIEVEGTEHLGAVFEEYKDFTRLEIFLPDGILIIDDSTRQKKMSYYTDQLQCSLHFSEYFPGVIPTIVLVNSEEFLHAFQRKISPSEVIEPPASLGLFARFVRWWRNRGTVSLPHREPTMQLSSVKSAHEIIAESLTTASEDDDTQSSEGRKSPVQSGSDKYKEARAKFLGGNYEEAIKIFKEMFLSFEGEYIADPNVSLVGYDSVSLKMGMLIKILRKNNANFLDVLMIDELLQQSKSETAYSNLTDLQSALQNLLGRVDYSHIDYRILPREWQVAFQLFILERKFYDMQGSENKFTYKRDAKKLQEEYLALVKSNKKDSLVQAMAKRSHLLNYDGSGSVSKTRIAVMNMFGRDPVAYVQQMFNVLAENQLSDPSMFISQTVAKVGLNVMIAYLRDHYHPGLNILIENSSRFREVLLKDEKLMLGIASYGIPQMRQALRSKKLALPESVKTALTKAVEDDVEVVCNDFSHAQEKFKDEFFVDEIEANPELKQRIKENKVIYGAYKNFEPRIVMLNQ